MKHLFSTRLLPAIRSWLGVWLVIAGLTAQGQAVTTYGFTAGTGATLQTMTSSTTAIGSNSAFNGVAGAVANIGFTFRFGGTNYTQFWVNSSGILRFGNAAPAADFAFPVAASTPGVAPLPGPFTTADGSVRYKVIGSSPNRQLIVDWNVGTSSGPASRHFQVWLTETTDVINFVYAGGFTHNTPGSSVGIATSASVYRCVDLSTNTSTTSSQPSASGNIIAAGQYYRFTPPPSITSFTPSIGPIGTSVTITGTYLTGATAARVNGTAGTITANTATSLTFTVGAGSTTGAVSVTTPGGTATGSTFTIPVSTPTAPTALALSSTSVAENVAANTVVGTFTTTDPNTSDTFTYSLVSGTGSTDNASFNINGAQLRISGSPNFETKSSYAIRVRTTDQTARSFEQTFTITITNVNETPTALGLSNSTIAENTGANAVVGTLSTTDPDAGNTFTYTLVSGTGSTDNALCNISGNQLRITTNPDFETRSSYAVRLRSTDQGGLFFERAVTITITNVNETPTALNLSNSTVAENTGANAVVGNLSTTDSDIGNTFTYSLVSGTGSTDNALVNISGNQLRITASPNFEAKASYAVRVRTTDNTGLFLEQAFTINVTNVNENPTALSLSNSTVVENTGANVVVGNLSTTDPDVGNTFTYSLVTGTGSTDNALVNISGTQLRITASPNFETRSSYAVRIRSTDQSGLFVENNFTITVIDANETPTALNLSNSTVVENTGTNAVVGNLSTTDQDAGNTFTYTLVSGTGSTDNALVNISGNQLRITASPDFETKSSYAVRIRTTDNTALFFEQTFTITVTNVNETPTALSLSNSTIAENTGANAVVGNLSTTDPDAGNTFTYTLVTGTGSTDNTLVNISGNQLRITANPDFEAKSSYAVRVRTTDNTGLFLEQAFTITVTNANENPTALSLSATSVAENTGAHVVVGTFSTTDPDVGNTFTYTLVTGIGSTDNGLVNIISNNLRITASPNFEAKSSYALRVRTTDNTGLFFEQTFTITVTDVNEAPTALALSATSVAENTGINAVVGSFSTTDPDVGNTFTYSLISGAGSADNAFCTIAGNNLRISANPNFEVKSSYAVRVRTTDQNGLFFEQAFTITVTNVNEAPTALALSPTSIAENTGANAVVGSFLTIDPDAGSTFTYSLVAGTGSTDNALVNISGNQLRIIANPDFEAKSSYAVRVRSTDQGGLLVENNFTISITNANEAPTALALSSTSVAENTGTNAVVGNLSTVDPDAGNSFTYSLVTGAGSTDNALVNISGNQLRITASPDFETKSSYAVHVRSTDQDGLFVEQAFTITVTNVNEAPTALSLSNSTIAENTGANAVVGNLSTTDPDAGNTFTYSLVSGTGSTDNALVNISGNQLRITANPDFETKSSYAVRVRSTDQGGLFVEQTFTITVTDVNEVPTVLSLSNSTITENTGVNAVVGNLSTTDPDVGNTFTYSLVTGTGSTDNALVNISGNQLRITANPDFETKSSYAVRVRSTDQDGLFVEQAFTITVTNVNEAPTALSLSNSTIAENTGANAVVGNLSTTDPDAGNTFTYTLVSGTGSTDNTLVNISGNQLRITASPDFETKSSYAVRVRSTDQGGLFTEQDFVLTVTDGNETPTTLSLSNSTVAENTGANAVVGNLSTTDPDAGNTFTYTLVAGAGSTDNALVNISGNQLRITANPDFETKSSYAVRVRSTDQGGLFTEQDFVLTVTDENEAPGISPQTFSIAENSANGTAVGTVVASDPDAGTTLIYNITAGNTNGAFSFVGQQLQVANVLALDFETTPSFNLTVTVSDGAFTSSATITVDVTDVVETAPDLTVATTQTIPAGTYNNVVVTATGNATLGGAVEVQGTLVVQTGGSLDDGCQILTGAGSFALEPGTTLRICHPQGIAASGASGAIQVTGARSFSPDASYLYSGTTAQVTGSGLPASVQNLRIDNANDVSLSGSTSVRQLLTLANTGNLMLGAFSFTLLSDAATTAMVVNTGSGRVIGAATVQRYLSPNGVTGIGYHHLSAPVTNATVADLEVSGAPGFTPVVNAAYNTALNPTTVTPYPTVFGYDETRYPTLADFNRGYFSPSALTSPLVSGRGYSVYMNPLTVDFVGTLATGTVAMGNLTRTGNFTGNTQKSGWQLLGNPYPAPIDWDVVTVPAGMSNSISVYQTTGGNNGVYLTRANGLGTLPDGLVPMGQAFFARVTGTSPVPFAFQDSYRLTSYANPTAYRPAPESRPVVQLTLAGTSAPARAHDEVTVYFEAGATPGADDRFDGVKPGRNVGAPTLAALIGREEAAIDGLPAAALGQSVTVELTAVLPAAGTYQLAVSRLVNFAGTTVELLDRSTGTRYDLSQQPVVRFTTNASGEMTGRFALLFNAGRVTGTAAAATVQANHLSLLPNPASGGAEVRVSGVAPGEIVRLFDATGRLVTTTTTSAVLPTRGLPTGVYVVRVGTRTQRLVVE